MNGVVAKRMPELATPEAELLGLESAFQHGMEAAQG